ncbi:ADP-ribosylglycohydrolase family protein [Nocardia rhamnosiphila]|uniref:ADP-ribosylglycohydrolase family protein n=1 Tax=Nocardia rhamnosiphila TaxID=426716 RepID=UPI00340E1240
MLRRKESCCEDRRPCANTKSSSTGSAGPSWAVRSVMRSAPFGLTGAGAGTACTTAARCAQLTHGHPTGGTAAGPFAALIDGLVAGAAFPTALDEVLALLTTLAGADETIAALSRAVSLPTERATPPSTTATGIGPANAIHSTRPNDSEHMTSTITETSTKSLARSHPAAIT